MPNIFDALKQKCLTFLTVFLLENKKDTREISRIFYAAIAPDCGRSDEGVFYITC